MLNAASWTAHRLGPTRRRLLARVLASLSALGLGPSAASTLRGVLKPLPLRHVSRIDAGGNDGWLARDSGGRLWQLLEDGSTRQLGEGLASEGSLDVRHGRIAGRGIDGRLWVRDDKTLLREPQRSAQMLAPQGGLCGLPLAMIGLIEDAGRTLVARLEPTPHGQWQVVARSDEPVLPDAMPVIADLEGQDTTGHVAVLAGPDRHRYPHAVLGDDVEGTRVLWLERHSLQPLRTLVLDAPDVFEDRQLRPWRLPDGRIALVTVRSGPSGAQVAVIAASQRVSSALEIASVGPFIGTRNRWLSPASVDPGGAELYAVHTPHIGGVLHRYRSRGSGSGLSAERVATGLTNHRLGARDLDITARVGRWLLVPVQDWQQLALIDLETASVAGAVKMDAPILQLIPSTSRRSVAVLTRDGVFLYTPG